MGPAPALRSPLPLQESLPPFSEFEALEEASRCLFCYDAPCAHACPTHIDVPQIAETAPRLGVRRQSVYHRLDQLNGLPGPLNASKRQPEFLIALALLEKQH